MSDAKYHYTFRCDAFAEGSVSSINGLALDMETPEVQISGITTARQAELIAASIFGEKAQDVRYYLSARVSENSNTMCYEILDSNHAEHALRDLAFDHSTATGQMWKPRKIDEIDPDAIASLFAILAEDAELENETDVYIIHFGKLLSMESDEIATECGVEITDLVKPADPEEE